MLNSSPESANQAFEEAPKDALDADRRIYEYSPPPDYWERQFQEGLYPFIEGILRLHLPPPARLLEIGCEAGRATIPLKEKGYEISGLDFLRPALLFAQKKALSKDLSLPLIQADGRNLPLKGEHFDGVIFPRQFLSMFHGRDTRQSILLEASRVLKPKGHVFITLQNGALDPTPWHFLHYLYGHLFVYPPPPFSREKFRELSFRLSQYFKIKRYFWKRKERRETRDILIKTRICETFRENVPFHIYHLKDLEKDLSETGFRVIDCRDYLEFEKNIKIPAFLKRGAPYLILAAQKKN